MKVRTRYAPSPTGRMHVGNLRTALYEFLIARHAGGEFILRIEDTDQERFFEGALEIIYKTLEDTGLSYDEGPDKPGTCGPYVQSERVKEGIYMEYARMLVEKGEAYYCFCTKERLESLKQSIGDKEVTMYDKHCLNLSKEEVQKNIDAGMPFVIRQNIPNEGTTTFTDDIYGDITVENAELDDMILIKSDGYPTYNFANVVDDHLMGITHVVRGNEYLSSTPKYIRLYNAFGWDAPVFVHLPLITDEEHKKLSKRSGHSSFEDLIEQGFVPEAVVNFIALLGWSPEGNEEIFTLDELIDQFDYKHVSKSPAVFDMVKLRWMNGEYIKAMDYDRYKAYALPYVEQVLSHRDVTYDSQVHGNDSLDSQSYGQVHGDDSSDLQRHGNVSYDLHSGQCEPAKDSNGAAVPVKNEPETKCGNMDAAISGSRQSMSSKLQNGGADGMPLWDSQECKAKCSNMDVDKILELMKTRIEVFPDICEKIDFFAELPDYDISMYTHKKMKTDSAISLEVLRETLPILEAQEDYSLDALHDVIMQYIENKGVKNGVVLWPLRTAVSGKQSTPGGAFEIMEILGKDESLRRIRIGIEKLENA